MRWLRRLLGKGTARRPEPPAPQARPALEPLEDRNLMSAAPVPHGGPVLSSPDVTGVFLGTNWQGAGGVMGMLGVLESTLNIVNSSYMDMLGAAAFGVGRGMLDSLGLVPQDLPQGAVLTQQQIEQDLDWGLLMSTDLSWLLDPNRMLVVYVQPGVSIAADFGGTTFGSQQGAAHPMLGYHSVLNFWGWHVPYAVVAWPGGANVGGGYDAYTGTLSHEIAETATDPFGNGWYAQVGNLVSEIGDTLEGRLARQDNGTAVQALLDPYGHPITPPGSRPL